MTAAGFHVRTALTAVVLFVLAMAAGGGTGAGTERPSGPEHSSTATSASAPMQETLQQDTEAAIRVTDRFWADHWSGLFPGIYRPPRVLGSYDGASPTVPTCGGVRLTDNNALYCLPEDYLAWDRDLMAAGYRLGDSWVYLVIAHEWAHAIQQRLNRQLVSVAAELQADCLAGATLFGAARDGTLRFEEGDARELREALTVLADDTPWTRPGDHGNAQQRIAAFARGREGGVTACLPAM